MNGKKLIIFDLDETLIHATKEKLNIPEDFRYQAFYIYKRPGLDQFLEACSELYPIALWSSADDEYVEAIARLLQSEKQYFEFVWARSACWMKVIRTEDPETGLKRKKHQFIKPLEKIRIKGWQMRNLLIIDDSLYKVTDNPQNYIVIKAFEGDAKDGELGRLLKYLKQAINYEDFRDLVYKQ